MFKTLLIRLYSSISRVQLDQEGTMVSLTQPLGNAMPNKYAEELIQTARAIVAPGKGILAADESTGTIGKRVRGASLAEVFSWGFASSGRRSIESDPSWGMGYRQFMVYFVRNVLKIYRKHRVLGNRYLVLMIRLSRFESGYMRVLK